MSQFRQCCAYRAAADLKLLGKPGFHQPEARRETPAQYLFAQRVSDAPIERASIDPWIEQPLHAACRVAGPVPGPPVAINIPHRFCDGQGMIVDNQP
jgi:hypothetical protein